MIDFSKFKSLLSVVRYFNEEKVCRQALAEARWGDDVVCPVCGNHHCAERPDGRFRCNRCKHNFSCTVGTIFENTKIPLQKWFIAMYLISSHKKGISSHQVARDCEITQKTAWFMLQKIRSLYAQDTEKLSGEVECDEAYIGGRERNKHESKKTEGNQGRSTKTKTPVFGMIERSGKLVARKVRDTKGNTLCPLIRQFVKEGSRIYTDEYIGYNSLYESEYTHSVVRHNAREFVVGDAHTNGIEGFWSELKRSIFGIYHFVSARYLQRYVDEAVFRYNTREADEGVRFSDMFHKSVGVFSYEDVRKVA